MANVRANDTRRQKLLVAYYYCVLGMRGERLAKHLGLASATLARRLRDAKSEGLIREAVLSIESDELDDIYPYLSDVNLAESLQNFIGKQNLRKLIIVPKASGEEERENPNVNVQRVARAAAVRLVNLFEDGGMRKVGISFGSTLGSMVREILELPVSKRETPEWIPIFGDLLFTPRHPLYPMAFEYTSSVLAFRLAEKLRGSVAKQLSLPVPAYIPWRFMEKRDGKEMEERISTAKEFVRAIPAYRAIFGAGEDFPDREEKALITKMDTMITSVGGIDKSTSVWRIIKTADNHSDERREPEEEVHLGPIYDEEEWNELQDKGVVGDICGTFVTEDRVDGFPADSVVAQVNRRVLGPMPADFQRCTSRTQEKLLFSTELRFQRDLDNFSVSDNLRREFNSHEIELSQDEHVAVSIEEQDARWLIADELQNLNYIVRKKEDGLDFWRARNPGVIIVASGARKARTVASAISNRCITELICDFDLAQELARIKGIGI